MIKIIFKEKHLSIDSFTSINLPDFTILTGVNGAGKTHFLQALEQRKILIENLENESIVYFNYNNFYLENESIHNSQQIASERRNAWEFFNNQGAKGNIQNWRNQHLQAGQYNILKNLCETKNKSLWDLTREEISDDNIYNGLKTYRNNIQDLFLKNPNFKNNNAQGIFILLEKLRYSIDEITEHDFMNLYSPYSLKNDFLPTQMGKIFWDYAMRFKENKFKIFENKEEGKKNKVLSEVEFIKLYGQKPWNVVSSILATFRGFEFKINSPEDVGYFDDYQLVLTHAKKEIKIDFANLSSGEKVLMSLVACVYKLGSDLHFPKIILLDEIDASLHPSMIQNLLEVINDVFINRGTKVILATHSPTTIALAKDDSIYVMNKEGQERIAKKKKSEALSILTEGFTTLDEGLSLLDQISKKKISIISEGNNTSYIVKAIELYNSKYLDQIDIIRGIENITGKDQLKLFFDFFCKVAHNNKVIFVWDPDADFNSLNEIKNTIPFVLPKNQDNKKVTNGIENLFDQSHFTDEFYQEKPKPDGGMHKSLNKEKFKQHIIKTGKKEDFANFKSLFELIDETLKKAN